MKTSIKGRPDGPLAGRRVALKDNICLAGVPMTLGADVFDGYVPEVDATIVERILDAGGEIAGKAVCEYYCVSGGSHTSSSGPVHNPRKPGYTTGGSSSGSAALVAAGEVDMAIGGDQAGSIRIPASHCGIVGECRPTIDWSTGTEPMVLVCAFGNEPAVTPVDAMPPDEVLADYVRRDWLDAALKYGFVGGVSDVPWRSLPKCRVYRVSHDGRLRPILERIARRT